ncbi:BQ5605_C004g02706 [Microbotryum silenes-dioicae]|uniref:BQ5605_C004g02706 protein n=1 Tax=Microbotryum silenes-dioicae TaxID=796604 RepID=A0A2X0PAN5_9BASI|nr:BQ5605_C004g02706 [Microbotryum silenes-dioicae]
MATQRTIRRIVTTTPSISSWLSPPGGQPLLPTLVSIPPLPAQSKWFLPHPTTNNPPTNKLDRPHRHLNLDHLTKSGTQDPVVNIEHTRTGSESYFERLGVPWSYYLQYLDNPPVPNTLSNAPLSTSTLYLAQSLPPSHLLPDLTLPQTQQNFPLSGQTPSSLWMGRTPTTTPMHHDPDHNLFLQLCGEKKFRLMEPKVGKSVFEKVQERRLGGLGKKAALRDRRGRLRGEEMMLPGPEGDRDALERAVWEDSCDGRVGSESEQTQEEVFQVTVQSGQALLIPQGWWHAVRSRSTRRDGEEELSVSVNWWFR